jgi:hypothetical protein
MKYATHDMHFYTKLVELGFESFSAFRRVITDGEESSKSCGCQDEPVFCLSGKNYARYEYQSLAELAKVLKDLKHALDELITVPYDAC